MKMKFKRIDYRGISEKANSVEGCTLYNLHQRPPVEGRARYFVKDEPMLFLFEIGTSTQLCRPISCLLVSNNA